MVKQRSGCIVNATSGAHLGMGRAAAYAASKGAVASVTYNWAVDMMRHNVRVNAISPLAATDIGDVFGPRTTSVDHPAVPSGSVPPEHNAPVVTFLLSDLSHGITGQVVRIFGGQLSVMQHPDVAPPVLERPEWTLEQVDEAFRTTLRAHLKPYGVGYSTYRWAPDPA
jgi:NAD(P)-dependent dehydrogenase (short-subunit alcohol dehydrogenase family)